MNPVLIDSITVLGKRLRIVERDLEKFEIDGRYVACEGMIEVEITLSKKKKEEILGHEIFHAFLDLSGWSNYLPEIVEESLCQLFERIVGVIKLPFLKEGNDYGR